MGENVSHRGSWFVPSSIQPLFLSQLSPSADLAVAVFLTFTGVASVLGNGVVLLVYCRKRKKLRPPELMTINLAICDFGFSLLGAPFFIISSLCHAWVFGETGCLWYGIQGFVFGIGSLLTTCLISLDRCLKICCLRYGQWVERRHVYLSIALLWVYTLFWASLPAFGFGSYGAEPYGTSCTINWWSITSSVNDRIYIFLILILCFGFPTLTIVTSYVAILLTVYRSNRTVASMPSSSVTHARKDLRLAKMAAVMCATFLLAWMPYATVSLISALVLRDNLEGESGLQESSAMILISPRTAKIPDIPTLLNWTATESYRQIYSNQNENEGSVADMNLTSDLNDTTLSFTLGKEAGSITRSSHSFSCLPPVATLIPAMLAKSHCMINPLIYQVMNREFRNDIYVMVLGQKKARRKKENLCERSMSVFYCQSWRRTRTNPTFLSVGSKHRNLQKQEDRWCSSGVKTGASVEDISMVADTLDFTSVYTVQHEETVVY